MQDANKNCLYVHEFFVGDRIRKGDTLQTAAFQPHGGIALYRDILANVLETEEPLPEVEASAVAADEKVQKQGDNPMSGNSSSSVSGHKGTAKVSNEQVSELTEAQGTAGNGSTLAEARGQNRNLAYSIRREEGQKFRIFEDYYANAWRNFTSKSFFKSKEGVSQRAMLLNESPTLTSVTDGATLLDNAKLPEFF